ncbi:MAG: AsmA-like C-terminal region-containing protein [Planctomycetota bacterium]
MNPPEDPTPVPQAPAPRRKRGLLQRLLMMLGLVVVLAVVAAFVFQGAIGRFAAGKIATGMSESLGTEVTIDKTSFSWFGGFELAGMAIKDPEGFGDGDAFSLGRVHVDFDLSTITGLIGGTFRFRTRIEAPRLVVRKDASGRSNWQAMLEAAKQDRPKEPKEDAGGTEVRVHADGGDDGDWLGGLQDNLRNFEIVLDLVDGSVALVDAASGSRHGIEELTSKLAISSENGGALFHLDGVVTGTGQEAPSPLKVTSILPFEGDPSLSLSIPEGLDLAPYRDLVQPFLDRPFEEFAGRIQGELRLASSKEKHSVTLGGKLTVNGLHLLGGPFGEGQGIVAEAWTVEPALGVALAKGDLSALPDLAGTRIDLGFLALEARGDEAALGMFADRSKLRRGTGLGGSLDLAAMAKQLRLKPLQGLEGKVDLAVAIAEPAPGAARPIAFRAEGKGLKAPTGGSPVPPEFRLDAVAWRADGSLGAPESATLSLRAPGLTMDATTSAGADGAHEGTLRASLGQAASWLAALLPEGTRILQPLETELTFEVDAEAARPRLDGTLAAQGLEYLDNRLEDARFELHFGGGKLDLVPIGVAKLNRGPLELRVGVEGLDGPTPTMTSKLAWSEGVATWGLTPYIRYAFPFLAGLPIDDAKKLAQLDYRSFAALDLELSGPLPKDMDRVARLTGKGRLQLSDGSFTPSQALGQVLTLLGTKEKLAFKEFQNSFAIVDGRVAIKDCKLGGGDGHVVLRGSTGLDGSLDVRFDLRDLLAQHRDGQAVLKALGDGPVEVTLAGTLGSPSVQGGDVLQKALQGGLQQGLEQILDGLGKGKKPEESLKDWFDKLKKK